MSRKQRLSLTPGQLALTRVLLIVALAMIAIGIGVAVAQHNADDVCTYIGSYQVCTQPPTESWPFVLVGLGLVVLFADMVIDASLSKPEDDE